MHLSGPHGENRSLRAAGLPETSRVTASTWRPATTTSTSARRSAAACATSSPADLGRAALQPPHRARLHRASRRSTTTCASTRRGVARLHRARPDGTILDRFTMATASAAVRAAAEGAVVDLARGGGAVGDRGELPGVVEPVPSSTYRHHRDGSSRSRRRRDRAAPPPSPAGRAGERPTGAGAPERARRRKLRHARLAASAHRSRRGAAPTAASAPTPAWRPAASSASG